MKDIFIAAFEKVDTLWNVNVPLYKNKASKRASFIRFIYPFKKEHYCLKINKRNILKKKYKNSRKKLRVYVCSFISSVPLFFYFSDYSKLYSITHS